MCYINLWSLCFSCLDVCYSYYQPRVRVGNHLRTALPVFRVLVFCAFVAHSILDSSFEVYFSDPCFYPHHRQLCWVSVTIQWWLPFQSHVSSTFSFLAGDSSSSKADWWYIFKHVFIRSFSSNSKKAKPLDFPVSFTFWCRIDLGLISEKCLLIDSSVAV